MPSRSLSLGKRTFAFSLSIIYRTYELTLHLQDTPQQAIPHVLELDRGGGCCAMLSFHLRARHETIIAERRKKKNETKFVGALAFFREGEKGNDTTTARHRPVFPLICITLTLDVVAICLLK